MATFIQLDVTRVTSDIAWTPSAGPWIRLWSGSSRKWRLTEEKKSRTNKPGVRTFSTRLLEEYDRMVAASFVVRSLIFTSTRSRCLQISLTDHPEKTRSCRGTCVTEKRSDRKPHAESTTTYDWSLEVSRTPRIAYMSLSTRCLNDSTENNHMRRKTNHDATF